MYLSKKTEKLNNFDLSNKFKGRTLLEVIDEYGWPNKVVGNFQITKIDFM